jgi:hypothetical protein
MLRLLRTEIDEAGFNPQTVYRTYYASSNIEYLTWTAVHSSWHDFFPEEIPSKNLYLRFSSCESKGIVHRPSQEIKAR